MSNQPAPPPLPVADNYNKIDVLEGIEAVRKRPGMYIGDTDEKGLHHLIWEVVDNSVDEHMAGACNTITLTIHENGGVSCLDNGRGIPVGLNEKIGKSSLEVALTVLHAGAKFDNDAYRYSAGLHGVGVSVVNGLSCFLQADVFRNGYHYRQIYEKGVPRTPLETLEQTEQRGTLIRFHPDPQIFTTTEFKYPILRNRLRELAFLNSGLTIILQDERSGQKETFFNEGGLINYLNEFVKGSAPLYKEAIHFKGKSEDVEIEIVFQHTDNYGESIYCFANNINTSQGGTHLSGFKTALTRTLNNYAKREKKLKDEKNPPLGEDYREGMVAIVSAYIREAQLESQTKVRLLNPQVTPIVDSIVTQQLNTFLEENPKIADLILGRAEQAKTLREQMKKFSLNARKKAFGSASFPTKLADCNRKEKEGTEVFIVEGDSAGGSAKMGRNTDFQAILPIKGKIINVEKARIDKMLKNSEIEALLQVIIPDWHLDEGKIVYTKVRYQRVIIMTDADVDGSHIRTLLLTFFFRYIPQLIEEGYLHIAQPPLFSVSKNGKNPQYYIYQKEMLRDYAFQGIKNSELYHSKNGLSFSGNSLENLLKIAHTLKEKGDLLSRSAHLNLEELIKNTVTRNWQLPQYQSRLEGEVRYFHSKEELDLAFEKRESPEIQRIDVDDKTFDPILHEKYFQVTSLDSNQFKGKFAAILADLQAMETLGLNPQNFFNGEYLLKSSELKEPVLVDRFDRFIEELSKLGQKGLDVKRYKGLGEMDPEELRDTTMNPEERTLLKVTMLDKHAVNQAFVRLMGIDVRDRRQFIESRAAQLNWDLLDI
jgi:DNA gyrase subunit B